MVKPRKTKGFFLLFGAFFCLFHKREGGIPVKVLAHKKPHISKGRVVLH